MRLSAIMLALTLPSVAHAQWSSFEPREAWRLGVDAGVGIVRSDSNPFSPGATVTLRGGYHFRSGLTPEMELGVGYWTGSSQGYTINETALSVMPGVRWGYVTDRILTGVAAHVGYGYLHAAWQDLSVSDSGLALELGFDLALQLTRDIVLGPHFSVEKIIVSKTGNIETGELWFQIGLGASFDLP